MSWYSVIAPTHIFIYHKNKHQQFRTGVEVNLPRGTLTHSEEWKNARPMDYFSRVEPDFSGVIRFFERGPEWNVFFLLFENGSLIGYYTTRGDSPLEKKLQNVIEGFEVEAREFTESEMEIARTLNAEHLLPTPLKISEIMKEQMELTAEIKDFIPDATFLAEIKKAREFRESFNRRRVEEVSPEGME